MSSIFLKKSRKSARILQNSPEFSFILTCKYKISAFSLCVVALSALGLLGGPLRVELQFKGVELVEL